MLLAQRDLPAPYSAVALGDSSVNIFQNTMFGGVGVADQTQALLCAYLVITSAQRNIHVPNQPLVKGPVPRPPELLCTVVVEDAPLHILWGFDAACEGPEAEEAPDKKELEPQEEDERD